jgi:hypothetical protein
MYETLFGAMVIYNMKVLHFKKGSIIIKLNAAVTNLNVWGNLMCHAGDITAQKRTT